MGKHKYYAVYYLSHHYIPFEDKTSIIKTGSPADYNRLKQILLKQENLHQRRVQNLRFYQVIK